MMLRIVLAVLATVGLGSSALAQGGGGGGLGGSASATGMSHAACMAASAGTTGTGTSGTTVGTGNTALSGTGTVGLNGNFVSANGINGGTNAAMLATAAGFNNVGVANGMYGGFYGNGMYGATNASPLANSLAQISAFGQFNEGFGDFNNGFGDFNNGFGTGAMNGFNGPNTGAMNGMNGGNAPFNGNNAVGDNTNGPNPTAMTASGARDSGPLRKPRTRAKSKKLKSRVKVPKGKSS